MKETAAAATAAAVATTAATRTRAAAAVTAKATVMGTAATSLPWYKFVRVGCWHKDGDE